jgi:phenylacetate-coenzyme A ligase PaaK-like adenylate-forming protein
MFPASEIFNIANQKQFQKFALQIFRFQYENNDVYKNFCDLLKINPSSVKTLQQIPFLPIQFFKTHKILSSAQAVQTIFTSSGTTGSQTSQHFVTDVLLYEQSYLKAFSNFYGNIEDYVFLALLPSYQERSGSSLIHMVNDLVEKTNNPNSGFFLYNHDDLILKVQELNATNQNIILIGVTFALLDLIESNNLKDVFKNVIIMETGGMKGRRTEMIRQELHEKLNNGFGTTAIHSEYGMTELLTQAYSLGNGIFECPNWMQINIRDTEDALTYLPNGKTGGINVIDLANINSCAFIATQDLGKKRSDNTFEVLGRFDNSDIRGCNLMVS